MFTIQNFSIASRLNNAEFLAFFVNLQKVMGEISTANLGITDEQKAELDELVKKLTDQVYATLGSEYTVKMQEADERRIAIYKRILTKLQVVNYAENDRELNALKEIQRTGDIFFPASWCKVLLENQKNDEARNVVDGWLAAHPDINPLLATKILQAAD